MALQPSVKAPAIPADIWMHVAQFIPDTDLCSMFSINRVFFQLAMDAKYRRLRFGADLDAEELRRLRRVRDPSLAHRVRVLNINRVYDEDSFDQENLNPGIGMTLVESIQTMTETVTCLTNVTELSLEWTESSPIEHLLPFLIEAWKAFGSSLRKLSFAVSLKGLAVLLSTADGLVSLRDLNVTVIKQEFVDTHGEFLATALVPFVNKVAPTLHSLSYSSSFRHVDPSPFFHRLGRIPSLERLRIVNHHGGVLTEPVGVMGFICNNATTLRHLDWDQGRGPSTEQHLMSLLRGNQLKEVFSNLCTLRVRVPKIPGVFSLIVQHIAYSADTLISLGLHGYEMTYEEANTVISLFTPHSGGNLKELSLSIEFLSPQLILLIAQSLPRLETLAICTMNIPGDSLGNNVPIVLSSHDPLRQGHLISTIFADTMRTYDICGWGLRDIDIQVAPWDEIHVLELMWVFAECIPSLQTFRGFDKDFYRIDRL